MPNLHGVLVPSTSIKIAIENREGADGVVRRIAKTAGTVLLLVRRDRLRGRSVASQYEQKPCHKSKGQRLDCGSLSHIFHKQFSFLWFYKTFSGVSGAAMTL